jgi:hypothetical protein
MSSIVDRSIARTIDLLGDLVDTQRQEIHGLKQQIRDMTNHVQIVESRERNLLGELEYYKMLVANLETDKK